ncbi:hypothetical protein Cv017_17320 [Chromobacterium subtsugae]|nr:hypothetical protein Cv017_17320 [Chromobacterium subtsugae]
MFRKFFGEKPVQTLEQNTSAIEIVGDIQGQGVNALRMELAIRLLRFPAIQNAYLARVKYKSEQTIRVLFVISAEGITEAKKHEIAGACSGVIPLDILFLEALPEHMASDIKTNCNPLLIEGLSLFECPLIVCRGANTEMPSDWLEAIAFYYVSAENYENALIKAVELIRSEGYEFKTVFNGKVNQLDPKKWWEEHVLATKWSQYAEHFPSQAAMDAIVATGGVFKAPMLGWKNKEPQ